MKKHNWFKELTNKTEESAKIYLSLHKYYFNQTYLLFE